MAQDELSPQPYSFKDLAARVVKRDGMFYRYLSKSYAKEYQHLMSSGLYDELVNKGLIIEHQELKNHESESEFTVILPEQIPFQSYPFEWSYSQWRKAALACLHINTIALQYGMILKDATPYNFFLKGGKAILFDTSSFVLFESPNYWLAYRQYCEEFLGPIALMHYRGHRWGRLTMAALRGMPLDFMSQQLPSKSYLNFSCFMHIHLHAKAKNDPSKKTTSTSAGFTKEKLEQLFSLLLTTIESWDSCLKYPNHWAHYYEQDIESVEYLADKEETIERWIKEIGPESVLDLGANTGKFSEMASRYAKRVIALEYDETCVDNIEALINEQKIDNLFTLLGDLTNTTPNLGLLGEEHSSIFERAKSDLVLGLALSHHLLIPGMIPMELMVDLFASLTNKYIIVEYINAEDSKVKILQKTNARKYPSKEDFELAFKGKFKMIETKKMNRANRTVYLFDIC